jgi:hypothetical protein
MAAVTCVTVALALYTVGTVEIQRTRRPGPRARGFLSAGVAMDVIATTLMVLASGRGLTLHGALGYSALALMAVDVALVWRQWARHRDHETPRSLHLYSRWAYLYWVAAYFTGAALVMASRSGSR